MSTEQVIREAIAAYASGDLEGALAHCAEDVRFCNQTAPGHGGWELDCDCKDGFREGLMELLTEFEMESYELVELIAQGPRAATRQNVKMTHRATGKRVDTQICDFWTVEGGKITRIHEFADTAEVAAAKQYGAPAVGYPGSGSA